MKNLLRLSISTLLILALFTMNGCKKNAEEPKEENSLSKTILLTSHIWKFNDLSTTSLNPLIQVAVNYAKASYGKNATINFLIDGTYTGSVTGQTENGYWEFNADETSIIIDKGTAYEIKANIIQLTSNVLELNATYHDATLGNVPVTIKLVK